MKSIVNKYLIKKFIESENRRKYYAGINDFSNLMSLYTHRYPDIKNTNDSRKWDHMNHEAKFDASNPMAKDRTNIISKITDFNNKKVLNIGFGPLNLENKLLHKINLGTWEGIDISKKSVMKAKIRFPDCKFSTASIMSSKLKKNYYDIILALEVLEHISYRNIFTVLKIIYSSLVKNGLFIVSVPLNEGLEEMLYEGINPNSHLRIYNAELIKSELKLSNFKIIKEIQLSAFNKHYHFKKIIKYLLPSLFENNNIILVCQKT